MGIRYGVHRSVRVSVSIEPDDGAEDMQMSYGTKWFCPERLQIEWSSVSGKDWQASVKAVGPRRLTSGLLSESVTHKRVWHGWGDNSPPAWVVAIVEANRPARVVEGDLPIEEIR